MSKKITYLLGAGASAGKSKFSKPKSHTSDINLPEEHSRFFVIPPVKYLYHQMQTMSGLLKSIIINKHNDEYRKVYLGQSILDKLTNTFRYEVIESHISEIADNISFLALKHIEFGTIDTYAKYLWNNDQKNELNDLKYYFSIYLILEQCLNLPNINTENLNVVDFKYDYDSRYITFLTSIMNQQGLPENVKILNWNYDFQVEYSYLLSTKKDFDNNYASQEKILSDFLIHNKFVYHLNGTVGEFKNIDVKTNLLWTMVENQRYQNESTLFQTIFEYFNPLDKNEKQLIFNFAFENESGIFNDIVPQSKDVFVNHLKETEILVVIGYSFPYFNREVDNNIFNEMLQTKSSLRKIYIQTKDENFDKNDLLTQFDFSKSSLNIDNIAVTHNCDNFLIPREL